MNTSGEAAEQIVRMSLEGFEVAAKITGAGAKNIAVLLYSILKEEKKTKGKARLTNMLRSGKELKVFTVKNGDLKKFTQEAKKYGVLYCVLADRGNKDPNAEVDVIARAEDASKISRIAERFKLASETTASIVTETEKSKDEKTGQPEPDIGVQEKAEKDKLLDELMGKPIKKEENAQNPSLAKTEKSPQSEPISEQPKKSAEGATMDDNKKQLLTDIFWEMNEISSRTESKTETVITETDDGHGNIVQTETTQTRTYLYITVSHKTAEEMADQYGFDDEQRQMLSELLADENNSLWSQVLYGISVGDGEIVTVALSQVGNTGGQPYWSWYGFNSRVEWCACFVSWCANECGYIENGIIPKFAGCIQGSEWFKERGQWQDGSFTPEAGHIIFFDWEGDGLTDHVGIVERVENGTVYTVEGNSGDACRQNSYSIGSSVIYGYGIPAY